MCTDNAENTRTYTVIQVSKLFGVKNRYQITEESIKRLVREGSEKHDR